MSDSRFLLPRNPQNHRLDKGVSQNGGTPKSSILIGFSIINHPFWDTTILGHPHKKFGEINFPSTQHFTAPTKNVQVYLALRAEKRDIHQLSQLRRGALEVGTWAYTSL